jgi:hypothetical protein
VARAAVKEAACGTAEASGFACGPTCIQSGEAARRGAKTSIDSAVFLVAVRGAQQSDSKAGRLVIAAAIATDEGAAPAGAASLAACGLKGPALCWPGLKAELQGLLICWDVAARVPHEALPRPSRRRQLRLPAAAAPAPAQR